jgi:hypothetical protein
MDASCSAVTASVPPTNDWTIDGLRGAGFMGRAASLAAIQSSMVCHMSFDKLATIASEAPLARNDP